MNYTTSRIIGGEQRTYINIGFESNYLYRYNYVKEYTDLIARPKLEKAMKTKKDYHKELVAEYHTSPYSGKAGFAFYISFFTEEQWFSADVELKLEAYLLDGGERYLFEKHLIKEEIGEQVAKIISQFISFIETDKKKIYSIY